MSEGSGASEQTKRATEQPVINSIVCDFKRALIVPVGHQYNSGSNGRATPVVGNQRSAQNEDRCPISAPNYDHVKHHTQNVLNSMENLLIFF